MYNERWNDYWIPVSQDIINYQGFGSCYQPQHSASADNSNRSPDNSTYHAQTQPITYYLSNHSK